MKKDEDMRTLAERLAKDNVEAEPEIKKVLWFPSDNELRVVDVLEDTAKSDEVVAFHFGPDKHNGFPVPMAIALIRPDEEVRKIPLPDDWGGWENAVQVWPPIERVA